MRNVAPQEWEIRCDLAAAYRLIAHFGMDDLIYTHLSARLPGNEHRFLLNRYGMMFDEITASSLVVVDPEGHALDKERVSEINSAGFTIHSAVHMSRNDAQCVMHTHTHTGRHGGGRAGAGPAAVEPNVNGALRPHRLSRFRGYRG
ncbi:class II aldolase/adducin family protein [Bradyrhizobium sp. F1.4.3]|uniref:class II aldolase/adducin family protein n=1 Tax=Bradyrhizobium sp. F1.4.3 TaxID=3156356 RepID=UPI003397A579